MIVRISGEGQYELDDSHHKRLNELDDLVVEAVERGSENGFRLTYEQLLAFVRENGRALAGDDLSGSDVILPPADLTFDEACDSGDFAGEGLIPDPDPDPAA